MGYSTDAGLSFDNMPEALQEWMVAYKAATASSDFSNSYPTPTVAPLLKTKWGQGAPFNRKCPKYNGNPMLTGCTATAMAQILNYYSRTLRAMMCWNMSTRVLATRKSLLISQK